MIKYLESYNIMAWNKGWLGGSLKKIIEWKM